MCFKKKPYAQGHVKREEGRLEALSMKYFQNVVGIVRDLMSPIGTEKQYKEGMRKDESCQNV